MVGMRRNSERELVLSRRRALMLAAAVGAVSCGPSSDPVVCLSPPPEVCLSVPVPPCPTIRWGAFSGPSTALDQASAERVANLAREILQLNVSVRLVARIYDDGHADTATGLNEPRLAAVEQALREH